LKRGSPVSRSSPSSAPRITHTGCIQVLNQDNGGAVLGYISSSTSSGYYFIQSCGAKPVPPGCLKVTFTTDKSGRGDRLRLTMTNSDDLPNYPLFGLNQGRVTTSSDLAPGSANYLYVGGVANPGTAPGSVPMTVSNDRPPGNGGLTSETDVWKYNSATGSLTAHWINSDHTRQKTFLFTQFNALYAGEDPGSFYAQLPVPVTNIEFKFVPTSP